MVRFDVELWRSKQCCTILNIERGEFPRPFWRPLLSRLFPRHPILGIIVWSSSAAPVSRLLGGFSRGVRNLDVLKVVLAYCLQCVPVYPAH